MANATPFSDYANFSIALRGVDLIDRQTNEKVFKYQIWHRHISKPKELQQIQNHKYSRYLFVPHVKINNKNIL